MNFLKSVFLLCAGIILHGLTLAQTATVKIDGSAMYQKITGFGGFVCSGTFAYNHMTTAEIQKLWGKNSEAGCNIMRLYIPVGEAYWSQSLATAQLAKSLGITVFASPWSMPGEWKTSNNVAAVYTDANGVQQNNYLKEAYYTDYANYLNKYVTYLHNNGVDLDAISIQNEPDMPATYAGCIWTPAQIAKFVKYYAPLINCKIIAPESVGLTDNYASAFLEDSVSAQYDIYGGHQYGAIQSTFKNVQNKGKEVWMTEFLINWNADENTTRNFNWSKDAFSFANKLNTALLSNVNAWVHYAAKRFYGLIGDGTNGTTTGVLTKRGYILSHYAKYTTGSTRIGCSWTDDTNVLSGSSYLSATGDSVIVMVINPSSSAYTLTVDLPFFTLSGKSVTTTESLSMSNAPISLSEETCRPKVSIAASSFTTLIFIKSSDRPASQMTGSAVHYNKVDGQSVTNTAFGSTYKLSGKKVTFDHSNFLISANTTSTNGYLQLDDRYNKLVFHIDSIKSTLNYTSATTTLYYINSSGSVSSHNYGTVTFNQNGNFDWVLDISRSVLTDGCTGILGISNSNYSSVLTIKFGDVYFKLDNEKMFRFSGIYSRGDSYLLDCLEDSSYTSLDFSGTTDITSDIDWYASASNKNCIYYTDTSLVNTNTNIVTGKNCNKLTLTSGEGNFYVPAAFKATTATYTRNLNGYDILVLPFKATVPTGIKVYVMVSSTTDVTCSQIFDTIPANTPVLIQGTGTFTFEGSGNVSTPHALKVNNMNGVYVATKAPAGSYFLKTVNGVTAFYRVISGSEPTIPSFCVYLTPAGTVSANSLLLKFDEVLTNSRIYDFSSDEATTQAGNPPAKNISIGIGNTATAGVVAYTDANNQTSNCFKPYSGGQRNNTGIADLNLFPSHATDYSVTWKQSIGSPDKDYKVGVLLRGNAPVGDTSALYVQGMMQGYLFLVNSTADRSGSTFSLYRTSTSTTSSMAPIASNTVITLNPTVGQSVWYRASVSGTSSALLTFEYSIDSVTWNNVFTVLDVSAPITSGATQLVWGLSVDNWDFYLDNITYTSITPTPTTLLSTDALSGFTYMQGSGPSASQTFSVSGGSLSGNVVITAPENFEVSLAALSGYASSVTLSQTNGTINQSKVYVRLKSGLSADSYIGNISVASAGAADKTISVSGSVTQPAISVSVDALSGFTYTVGVDSSTIQSFIVSGSQLVGNILLTAPNGYELSLNSDSGFASSLTIAQSIGTVGQTTIYVRLKTGLTSNAYDGDITITSTSAVSKVVALTGSVITDVNDIVSPGATIVSKEYYSLTGQKVYKSDNLKGFFIVKNYMSDGTVRVTKVCLR